MLVVMQATCSAGVIWGAPAAVGEGLIGNSVEEGSYTNGGANVFEYTEFTPETSGAVNYGHFLQNYGGGQQFTCGLYTTSGTILAYSNTSGNSSSSPVWINAQTNTEVTLQAATTYICGRVTNDSSSGTFRDDNESGFYVKYIPMTYSATLSNADFSGASIRRTDEKLCIVFNNQPGAPS